MIGEYIVPETTLQFFVDGDMTLSPNFITYSVWRQMEYGEEIGITWDGTDYVCVKTNLDGYGYIGNFAIVGGATDTGEPFLMYDSGAGILLFTTDTGTEHTYSIWKEVKVLTDSKTSFQIGLIAGLLYGNGKANALPSDAFSKGSFYKGYVAGNGLNGHTINPNLAPLSKMSIWSGIPCEQNGFEWILDKNAVNGGLRFEPNGLTVGETYTISYRIQKLSGTLLTVRGHCQEGFTTVKWSIDGVEQNHAYNANTATPNVADDDAAHYVVYTGVYKATGSQNGFFVQPNRMQSVNVKVAVWDFKVELGTDTTAWIPAEEDVVHEVICQTCEGTGYVCAHCGGSHDDWACLACNNHPVTQGMVCGMCQGDEMFVQSCSYCNGTGITPTNVCPTCAGQGIVSESGG